MEIFTVEDACKVLQSLYSSLVENEMYAAASLLCWGDKTFDPRPYFVRQVWKMLRSSHKWLIMGSAAGGKSFNVLIHDFHDWARDPWNTTIKYISTTAGHAKAQAMSTLVRLHRESVIPMPGYTRQGFIGMDKDDLRSSISELAIDKGSEVAGRSGKLQGFHPYPRKHEHPKFGRLTRVRARLEECEDIPDPVWPGVANILSTAGGGNVSVGGMFNPRKRDSMTARMVEPEQGWGWFDIDKTEHWKSKKGFDVLRLDGAMCENVIERRIVYPGLIDYEGFNQYPTDSADHYTFARGAYPEQSVSFTIIQTNILDPTRGTFLWQRSPTPLGALDMAEEGKDKAIYTAARYGLAIAFQPEGKPQIVFPRSKWCVQIDQQFAITKRNTILMGKETVALSRRLGIASEWFGLDVTSSVTLGNWMELNWGPINKIQWGAGATNLPVLQDEIEKANDLYDNIKTEMWFATGKWAEFGYIAFAPHMETSVLFTQLCSMHYKPTGKTRKRCHTEKYKKDFGGESPDEASSCIMIPHVIRLHESFSQAPSIEPERRWQYDDVLAEPEYADQEEEMEEVEWI